MSRSFIGQDPFLPDLLAEMLGRCLEPDQVDQQQGRRLVLEVELDLQPVVAVHVGRLDREVDVRALEVVAAGTRAEQPYPLDRGMAAEAPRKLFDELAAGERVGQSG